jgi:hypothetical protein
MGTPIAINPVAKPAPPFELRGKWLIQYDPVEFSYPEVLALLPALQERLQSQKLGQRHIRLDCKRTVVRNRYFEFADSLFIAHNGIDQRLLKTDPGAFAVRTSLAPLARPVHSVGLVFPRLDSDPRWRTLGLPGAWLFLASGLKAHGFAVGLTPLSLPHAGRLSGALSADMAGFTLFEDLLPFLRPFLADFRGSYEGFLAVGGPFPTLAPLAAVQHLPMVNLFVRGEAEIGLPLILDALNRGDIDALFRGKGFFWQQPGLIVVSDFDRVNRPDTFRRLKIDLSFLQAEHLRHGLEMNFSRGCNRGCLFCCHAQGRKFRKLPLEKAEELLQAYKVAVERIADQRRGVPLERPDDAHDMPGRISSVGIPMNINDDDILQDPAYTAGIFALVRKHGYRLHGVQAAPASLMQKDGMLNHAVLELVADRGLYVDDRPLLWLGTDVFLPRRARRLGKSLPAPEGFAALLAELERRGLRHFHYWISSDGDSNWDEFAEELAVIAGHFRAFPGFGLLAHAPFVVPYPASRLHARLENGDPRLKVRMKLEGSDPRFSFSVVDRLETKWPQLNALLRNEKAGGEMGFFDLLKEKRLAAAAQIAYHFLKQEELQNAVNDPGVQRARKKLEETIAQLLEFNQT